MTYRKRKDREYFSIDSETVTRVLNKEYSSLIETTKNPIVRENGLDPYDTVECTEVEFKNAYRTAFDRISLMRIP